MTDFSDHSAEEMLRAGLLQGNAAVGTLAPILQHLLINDDNSLFSEELLARVRGMLDDISHQLLAAEGMPVADFAKADELTAVLLNNAALVSHLHVLALEWQLAERLQLQAGVDPVLSPVLQAMIASSDANRSAAAMTALAAQARFMQSVRRMELSVTELPGELFHAVLLGLRASDQSADTAAEASLRASYDESRTRIALLDQLVTGMGDDFGAALSISEAGVAIFLSALAEGSGQSRDLVTLATTERQAARMALSLRAAGLQPEEVRGQFLVLQPDSFLPADFANLPADRAAALLTHTNVRGRQ